MIKKIGVLSGVMTAAAVVVAAAGPASASPVSPAGSARPASVTKPAPAVAPPGSSTQYTAGAPGYGATSTSGFEAATETTTLVRGEQFNSSYQPFVTLEPTTTTSTTPTPEVELIPSTNSSAPTDAWFPNADAGSGNNPSSSFWIQPRPFPASSPCASAVSQSSGRGCFYTGETVTLTVYYNTGTNTAYMTIADRSNGDEYLATLGYNSGTSGVLTTAHFGDVWLSAYDGSGFTAPKRQEDLNSFTSVSLTDTSGHTRPLSGWTHFQRIMTSNGSSTGTVEITPGPLSWDGGSFGLTVK
ncbi:MAG TPA: hypothetical protein VN847_02810 [Streptosporangiaceae bacterium]|nr:hypothetical protein [Streptosporangiaceae bacterium]